MPDKKLDDLIGRHRATGSPHTVDQAAAALVRDAQLTFFQAKQLKLGRYKRFTIGAQVPAARTASAPAAWAPCTSANTP